MKWLALLLLVPSACWNESCDDPFSYEVVLSRPLSEGELVSCYLPVDGGLELCARGLGSAEYLSFNNPAIDSITVRVEREKEALRVVWQWADRTWLRDGDRYSLQRADEPADPRPVDYDFDTSGLTSDDPRCLDLVVARLP
jgi:hypothetical protein